MIISWIQIFYIWLGMSVTLIAIYVIVTATQQILKVRRDAKSII